MFRPYSSVVERCTCNAKAGCSSQPGGRKESLVAFVVTDALLSIFASDVQIGTNRGFVYDRRGESAPHV